MSLSGLLQPPERLTIAQAAAKYRYLNNPGSYKGPWDNTLAPYMVEPMNELASSSIKSVIFVGPAQSGKPVWVETKVPTPDGWLRLGDVKVGDIVFSEKGLPTTVTYGTEVYWQKDCYRIVFDDGTDVIADGDHRWGVNDQRGNDPYALSVKNTKLLYETYIIKTSSGKLRYRYSIPLAKPLVLPAVDLPIDPYILGLWLGDGSHSDGALCLGLPDAQAIIDVIRQKGCSVTLGQGNSVGTSVRVVVTCNGVPLRRLLKNANLLQNKTIPDGYLRSSEAQRRELLKGFMDTDGTIAHNGRLQISQTRLPLFNQLLELVRTLGYKPMCDVQHPTFSFKGEKKTGADSYRLSFSADDSTECFTLNRQITRHQAHITTKKVRPTHWGRRFIRKIEPVESVPVRCISVENDSHLFLLGEQMVPTHNTDALVLNWLTYSVRCDPMDMILYSPSMAAARDFSIRRVDRLHRHSPEIGGQLRKDRDADNKFDKHYTNGMLFSLSWPSSTEMAGKPIPRVALTDYDRMEEDIDGEGSPFDLASKRTTTFGSFAKTLAESSPSRELTDTRWIASTAHEAPPTTGILALYNRGDRRRFYWPCPHCHRYFEGNFSMLTWSDMNDDLSSAETVRMECPKCGDVIHMNDRHEMTLWGTWLKDGEAIDKTGIRYGVATRSSTASFWLNGVAASFVTWQKLVETFLVAEREYKNTGSEESLRKFYNTDLSEVYIPKSLENERIPEHLKARAEKFCDPDLRVVPESVRFLVACVDVQKNMFVVQIHGICPGEPFDMVLIDRFDIRKSKRTDDDDDTLWVKPGTYLEDWDLIVSNVMDREYPLANDLTRLMAVKLTLCDSGGKAGVTTNAYNFYRKLRSENKHGRFHLVKGEGNSVNQPRARVSFPDSNRKDRNAAARGDVPVLMLNVNIIKDSLSTRLDCIAPGKGMYRFPDWLEDWWYREMCAEVRTAKGWENPNGYRNEAWDLSTYCIGGCASKLLLIEHIDWNNPPGWAGEWSKNDLIRQEDAPKRFAQDRNTGYDFKKLAQKLA